MSHRFIPGHTGDALEVRIVFDAPPGRNMPTLVGVEDASGRQITGAWRERPDGYWELVFQTFTISPSGLN